MRLLWEPICIKSSIHTKCRLSLLTDIMREICSLMTEHHMISKMLSTHQPQTFAAPRTKRPAFEQYRFILIYIRDSC